MSELKRYRLASYLLITAGTALILYGVMPRTAPEGTEEPVKTLDPDYVLQVGTLDLPTTLDPNDVIATSLREIMRLLYDNLLVLRGASAEISPHLVASWSYNPVPHVYRMKLREGVRFWDGTPLTAHHVKENFEFWLSPSGLDAPVLYSIQGAREFHRGAANALPGIAVLDDSTFEIRLNWDDAQLLRSLSFARFQIIKRGPRGRIVGTGPFIPRRLDMLELHMERNEDYFQGKAALRGMRFVRMNGNAIQAALRTGGIDLTWDILAGKGWESPLYRKVSSLTHEVQLLYLNTTFRHFDTEDKRREIFRSIDRGRIRESCRWSQVAHTIIPPGFLGHDRYADPTVPPPAGPVVWPRRTETVYVENWGPDAQCLARELDGAFRRAGLPLAVRAVPFSEIEELWRKKRLPAGVEPFFFVPGSEIRVFLFFSRENREFLIGRNSDEYESLVGFTKRRKSMEAQAEFLQELDRATIARGYALPLFYPEATYLVKQGISLEDAVIGWTPDWSRVGKLK